MNVKLPPGVWVDLYDATGIVVGVQIQVFNITPNDARVVDSELEPDGTSDHLPVLFGRGCLSNTEGDLGAWGMCVAGGAIDVREFTV